MPKRVDDVKRPDPHFMKKLVASDEFVEDRVYGVVSKKEPEEPVTLFLTRDVPEYGKRGQMLTLSDPRLAREALLLPGLAKYASRENVEAFDGEIIPEEELKFSTEYARAVSTIPQA